MEKAGVKYKQVNNKNYLNLEHAELKIYFPFLFHLSAFLQKWEDDLSAQVKIFAMVYKCVES